MRNIRRFPVAILLLALFVAAAPLVYAQEENPLSNRDTKKLLKASDKSLKKARNALEQDNPGQAAEHAARYSETMARLNDALARGDVKEKDFFKVIERVDKATLKHEEVLLDLLASGRIPEQARSHIEDALAASRTGHDRATDALINHSQAELPSGVLDRRAAIATGKKNDALLRHAERAQKRGDNAALGRSVGQITANMETVNGAIQAGAIDQRDAISVLDRVSSNTRRQISKLEDLLGEVPEQARLSIERALQESVRGHQTSTQALRRSRAAAQQAGWGGTRGRPSGIGGGSSGGAGGQGGRPSGAGPPSGRPGGPPPRN